METFIIIVIVGIAAIYLGKIIYNKYFIASTIIKSSDNHSKLSCLGCNHCKIVLKK